MRYTDPTGEEVNLSQLSDDDRKKLIEALQRQSGLQVNYNEKSGLLAIVGKLDGGSDTYRAGLTALINDETTFNVLDRSMYSANGVTQNVNFGLYDPNNHNTVLDFSAFSKHPDIDLDQGFYHEGVAHGEKGFPDFATPQQPRTAVDDTAKVARENLPQIVSHKFVQPGDHYISLVNPRSKSPTLGERLFGPAISW